MTNIKNKNKKIIFYILITILVVIFFIYFNNTNKKNTNNNTIAHQELINTKENLFEKNNNFIGTLYFINMKDNNFNIYSKTNDQEIKLIFTDKDKNEKIKYANSMSDYLKILAYFKSDQSYLGSLYLISADKENEYEKIIDDFSSNEPAIISPDGEKIIYTLFSNVEFDYGHTLYMMNIQSKEITKIVNDPYSITNLTWDKSSKNIIYSKNNSLYSINIDTMEEKDIYNISNEYALDGIDWIDEDNIIISLSNTKKKQSNIIKLNIKNKEIKNLFELDNILNSKAFSNENYENILYILNNEIYINKIDNTKEVITEANNVIKWSK